MDRSTVIGRLPALVFVSIWFVVLFALVRSLPDGIVLTIVGIAMMIVLAMYCGERSSRGDAVFAITLLPAFAGHMAQDLFDVSRGLVAWPLMPVALVALWWIDRDTRRAAAPAPS